MSKFWKHSFVCVSACFQPSCLLSAATWAVLLKGRRSEAEIDGLAENANVAHCDLLIYCCRPLLEQHPCRKQHWKDWCDVHCARYSTGHGRKLHRSALHSHCLWRPSAGAHCCIYRHHRRVYADRCCCTSLRCCGASRSLCCTRRAHHLAFCSGTAVVHWRRTGTRLHCRLPADRYLTKATERRFDPDLPPQKLSGWWVGLMMIDSVVIVRVHMC